jgi:hypothetical protein
MKVRELIDELQKHDPEDQVLVDQCDGTGYGDVTFVYGSEGRVIID